MKSTNDYLDAFAKSLGISSDYAIAKKLSVTRQAVSKWRNGLSSPDTESAWFISETIGVTPSELIAAFEIERAKRAQDEEKETLWMRRLQAVAGSFLIVFAGFFAIPADATPPAETKKECRLCQIIYLLFEHSPIIALINNVRQNHAPSKTNMSYMDA